MRIRPNAELAQIQNRNSALARSEAVSRSRFDSALSQAAQGVQDGTDPLSALSVQARQALTDLLNQLSGQGSSDLGHLARHPELLAALVASQGEGAGLGPAESARLVRMLATALPRLLQLKARDASAQAGRSSAKAAGGSGAAQSQVQVPAAPSGPVQGDAFAAVLALLSGTQSAPAYAPEMAFAAGPAPDFALPQVSAGGGTGGLAVSADSRAAASMSAASDKASAAPAQAQPGSTVQTSVVPEAGPQVGGQPGSAAAEFPATLDIPAGLALEVLDPSAGLPLSAQADSLVTLKGDGSWVYPQSAPVASARPVPAPAQPQAQADANAAPARVVAPLPATAGSFAVLGGSLAAPEPLVAAGMPTEPLASAPGEAIQAQAVSGAAPSLDPAIAGPSLDASVAQAEQQSGQAQVQSGAGTPSQAQASLLVANQAAVAPGSASPSGNGRTAESAGPTRPGAANQGSVPSGAALQVGAAAVAAVGREGAQGGATSNNGAWPAGSAVPAYVADAVARAVNESGAATPGRLLIRLSPASLGLVQVDLVLADGKLTAHLVTGRSDVRDALARDLSGFKASLESHGVAVNEVSVALGMAADSGGGSQPRQDPGQAWRPLAATLSRPVAATTAPADPSGAGLSGLGGGFSALA